MHNVNESSAGNYDCVSNNQYGEEKKTLRLIVGDTEHVPKNHTGKGTISKSSEF